jgi:hypothetical protein
MSRHIQYGSAESFSHPKLRRRLGSIIDEVVIVVRDLQDGPNKRALKRELTAIGDAIRALGEKILGQAFPA